MFEVIESYLTPNRYSRPQIKMSAVKGIVIHWVANPMSSASFNRNFFENKVDITDHRGSAHYIINLDGNVIKCIPEDEMAFHVLAKKYNKQAVRKLGSDPNNCTIGIKCTHVDWNGKMTNKTFASLIKLTAKIVRKYNLNPQRDLYLHYDITGTHCHKWFLDNNEQWHLFKKKVADMSFREVLTTLVSWFKYNTNEWKNFKDRVES